MIANLENLANLPHSSLPQLQAAIGETQRFLADAQSLALDVATIEQGFAQDYGASAVQGDFDAMVAGARERWETSAMGFEDALRIKAKVVGNTDCGRTEMDALIRESQSSARWRSSPSGSSAPDARTVSSRADPCSAQAPREVSTQSQVAR